MNIEFSGKRALVTGAGKGIGRELAKTLVKLGAETYALSRTASDLDSLKEECPEVNTILCDISDWDFTEKVITNCGRIDLLVNNAAVAHLAPFLEITKESIDKSYDVNYRAIIQISQIVAKRMIEEKTGGSIVNLSSQASLAALADHTVYCSIKAAVDQLTKVMALELGPKNIRVNAVNPTVVNTEMGKVGWSDPVKKASMMSKIPLGRFAEVEDVVNAIVFLLSDKASMITGTLLPVDGGFLV
jgi:L-xylulose reductase